MSYSDVLSMIGGLCLFLFGMQVMGSALEKRAGGKLSTVISRLTSSRLAGFVTGLGVTAVIQSSSATTVMVVGFVNSGIMTLKQAINVIMGANVGTTVTAWLLSLVGISSSNPFVAMFKPANFTPILALVGIVLYMMSKSDKKKDIGAVFLGFATLMIGMDIMSSSVSGLKNVPEFANILLMFKNPILGVLAGALLTAIIQSSSASVGILQALSATGQVSLGVAIPIIFGQNIGTCVTALISSVGANKNARRAAAVHLSFNIIGCALWLAIYSLADGIFNFAFADTPANQFNIAIVHTVFNLACTACLLPLSGLLEKLAYVMIPEGGANDEVKDEKEIFLDERLLSTPAFAIEHCRSLSMDMALCAKTSLGLSLDTLGEYDEGAAKRIREYEDETDKYEDKLGSYLVKLSAKQLSVADSNATSEILHMIGDFERIADHAVNVVESAEEMRQKNVDFSPRAKRELGVLVSAVREIAQTAITAYEENDAMLAAKVEPLEQVIDSLKDQIRSRHIQRLQAGECSLDIGFVLSDVLTNLERVADHCSNIAGCIIEMRHSDLDLHRYLSGMRSGGEEYTKRFEAMQKKYALE